MDPNIKNDPQQSADIPEEETVLTGEDAEFDLESIIEEFRDLPDEPAEAPAPEEPSEEPAADIGGDTIRMDLSSLPKGSYDGADHIDDEIEEAAPVQDEEPADEAFSEKWEPQYEQPMGEYIPPKPLQLHPRSRLKELKKKLVAGPEKRYYRLTELGLGKLQSLLIFNIISVLLCVGSTTLYHLGMVQEERLKLMLFLQLFSMLLSALFGSSQIIEGLADLVRGRVSLNTIVLFSFVICCVDGVMCLQQQRIPCCAPFSLLVQFSLFDALHRRRREILQMDTLRRATDLISVRVAKETSEGKQVLLRQEGQVEDFWEHYNRRGKPDKIISWYCIGALAAALAVGVLGGVLYGVITGLQIAAVTLLASAPATFFITLSRPALLLEKRLHKNGTLICGWDGMRSACGKVIFPVFHTDLFPTGTVKMNGVKFFGNRDTDEVVAYASALVLADQNGLAPLFEQVLESRNCHHLTPTDVQYYNGGISGNVRGEPVLVGNLSFLKEMGVEIPDNLKVSHAVWVAIDGVLSGLFAISYDKTHLAANGLHSLCAYRNLTPTICDGDFLMNGAFLKSKFGANPKRIAFADSTLRQQIAALEPDSSKTAAVLSTQNNLSALAYGVTGARALHKSVQLGLLIHMIGGIVGVGIMLTLTLVGALHLLTPMHVLLYQLVWCVPGLLITEWTRLI